MKKKVMVILATGLCLFSQAVSVYGADYEYDDLGRVTKVYYEDGSSVTYSYDANGNIVEISTETEWNDDMGEENGGISGEGSQGGEKGATGDATDKGGNGRAEGEKTEDYREEDAGEGIGSIEGETGQETEEVQEGKAEMEEQGGTESEKKGFGYTVAAILAILGIVGLVLLSRLKDRNKDKEQSGKKDKDTEEMKADVGDESP